AIVLAFAAEGATVIAASRTAEKMRDLPEISPSITPVALDVTDGPAVARAIEAAGPFDILVNCAGWVPNGTLLDCSPEAWARSLGQDVPSWLHTKRSRIPG